jgi:hypothetical protein
MDIDAECPTPTHPPFVLRIDCEYSFYNPNTSLCECYPVYEVRTSDRTDKTDTKIYLDCKLNIHNLYSDTKGFGTLLVAFTCYLNHKEYMRPPRGMEQFPPIPSIP